MNGRHPPSGHPRDRAGTEPVTARSPLRMRLRLAVMGFLFCLAGAALLILLEPGYPGALALAAVLVVAALAAVVDIAVIRRRLRRHDRG